MARLSQLKTTTLFPPCFRMFEAMIGLILLGCLAFLVKFWYSFKIFKKNKQLHELASMNRRDFEYYVAQTLKRKGWRKVKVNKGSQDGGYDVSGLQD